MTVGNNATVSPGNNVGVQQYSSGLTLNDGGTFKWEINNWTAIPVAGTHYDQIQVTGANLNNSSLTSGGYKIAITGLDGSNNVGTVTGFDSSVSRQWTIMTYTGISTTFDAAKFTIDTSAFTGSNTLNGSFSLSDSGSNTIVLTYTPVPEPGTILGLAAAGMGLAGWVRRRRALMAI